MTNYRIEMMTKKDYHEMMMGGNNYSVQNIDIKANSAKEAVEIAKSNNPEMIVNTCHVCTVDELKEIVAKRFAEYEAFWNSEEEKKAKEKARKAEREKAKAEALGLTIEEYKAKVKHDKKVRDAEARVAALKAELAKAEKNLEELKKGA